MSLREKTPPNVVILGAGFIGLSLAAAFRDAGFIVDLVEPDMARRAAAPEGIRLQEKAIALAGLSRDGNGSLTYFGKALPAVGHAALVLECGPEDLAVKQAIFADLLRHAPPGAVLATASSAIPISRILPDPTAQARCLVAHPVNPPAVLRLIELAPGPGTSAQTVSRCAELFRDGGFTPVTLGHEVEGFVLNRLQGAVLREAYRLVEEGVTDVEGIDTVMRLGLGPRWALSGPFETAELNTAGGIRAHAARLGPAYKRMGEARGETVEWSDALVTQVEAQRRVVCPADQLAARAAWRSEAVARLVALRDTLMGKRDGTNDA
ncbi:3-hydroxyacyl-CoA dehydrogenase NAD-binding domain-containing protein [Oceanibium sediminis]|uniref:3-hydroxyacyl-CoA dehydrogenase NAD-binding domain-containing protein n=1 Tax=Oceanibium sediminis TaxID=2026339 RepID=UPI000DD2F193|nr:3-hydroxyacyl-CoA dehydrogenase NAD-binding domain-containing protein [Oceanibium sediminis]